MLLGALGAILLDNILAGKGMNRARKGFVKVVYGPSVKNEDINTALLFHSLWSTKVLSKWT